MQRIVLVVGVTLMLIMAGCSSADISAEAESQPDSESYVPLITPQDVDPSTSITEPGTGSVTSNGKTLTITAVTRPADDLVLAADAANPPAEEGMEYVQVSVELTCSADLPEACQVIPFSQLEIAELAQANILSYESLEGVETPSGFVDVEPGERFAADLYYIVPVDAGLLLRWHVDGIGRLFEYLVVE